MTLNGTAPGGPPRRFPILTAPSRPAVVAAAGIVGLVFVAYLVGEVLATFVIGLLLVLVLDPLVGWLAVRGVPRWLASVIAIAALGVGLLVFGYIVISAVIRQGPEFIKGVLVTLASVRDDIAASSLPDPIKNASAAFFDSLETALQNLDLVDVIERGAAALFGVLGPLLGLILVLPFFMFYVLADLPRLADGARRSIPAQWRSDVLHVSAISVGSFTTYIRAEAVLMVTLGAITFAGLMLLSVAVDPRIAEFALLLAVIAAFSELIPTFGPIIALVPALIFTASLGLGPLIAVLLLYLVIMFIEGNILVPKIEGGKFELHPAIVIVLVLGGLALIGPLGAILAMPVTAAVRDVFRYAFERSSGMPPPVVGDDGRIVTPAPTAPSLSSTESSAAG